MRTAANDPGSSTGAAPHALVIGAARSGTTALCHLLDSHPRVHLSSPKEPHFLAIGCHQRASFTGPGDDVTINRVTVDDVTRWRSMFATAPGAVSIDGSVSTLYYARRSVEAIQRFCPDVQLIAVLRQPSLRAFSAHQYQVGRGWETETFERALELESQRIDAGYHHLWHYRAMGNYGQQLAPFVAAFGTDRLLVIDHDDFERDLASTLERCAHHLGIDPTGFDVSSRRVNEGGARPRALTAIDRALRSQPQVTRLLRAIVPQPARAAVRRLGRRRSVIDPDTKASLDSYYRDDAAALVRLLGPGAPRWCDGLLGTPSDHAADAAKA